MTRRDLFIGACCLLLLAVAIVRVAVPDRSRIRPISIEAFQPKDDHIDAGQTLTREVEWNPPTDVYVLGWNPTLGAPSGSSYEADLMLYDADLKTSIFVISERVTPPKDIEAWRPLGLPPGTGYLAPKGRKLIFRYRITNAGPHALDTKGATALVYFVPVEGN